MKKIITLLACVTLILGLCSCGKKKPEPIPELDVAQLVTVDDVTEVAGYTPVVEPSGTSKEGNVSTIMYRSEPIGQNDTVSVKVTQFTDQIGYLQIYSQYEQDMSKRSSAELVDSLGQGAYIAFPTIHVYDRGCLIEITAGSGADDTQREILRGLAVRAAQRVEEVIPEYTEE